MSIVLVSLQFILIALIAAPFNRPQLDAFNVILFACGIVVFAMAFFTMNRTTFTVMPEPREEGELVTTGIYSKIRHPMYLAVMLCGLSACLAYGLVWKWGLLLILLAVLMLKMRYEEKLLSARFDRYAAYRLRSKALIPFIY